MNKRINLKLIKLSCILVIIIMSTHQIAESFNYYIDQGVIPLLGYFNIWFMTFIALGAVSLADSKSIRIIWGLFFILFSFTLDLHYSVLHESLSMDSFMALWKEKAEAPEAIQQYFNLGLGPLLRAVLTMVLLYMPAPKIKGIKASLVAMICICIVSVQSIALLVKPKGIGFDGIPGHLSAFGILFSFIYLDVTTWNPERDPVSLPLTGSPKIKNIILIVDESIRGDFIDINLRQDTTPYLLANKNRIINFGLAVAGTNNSAATNSFLRMGAVQDSLLRSDVRTLFKNTLIWQYAHNASVKTAFIDCQRDGVLQNYMTETEKNYIDYFIQIPRSNEYSMDHNAVPVIKKLIQMEHGPLFIYINKNGTHFHYEKRYPSDKKYFKPTLEQNSTVSDRKRLVNSYKNSIRWTVDDFFSLLLKDLPLSETVIIYTSDHGQNLMNDGTTVTHFRFKNAIPQEVIVPLFILTDNYEVKQMFKKQAAYNFNHASHFYIFPTVLALFGYDHSSIVERYQPTLMDRGDHDLVFFTGNVRYGRLHPYHIPHPLTYYTEKDFTQTQTNK
ncbi:MAG TPA: sulfatase-like hydrolase/transferase [Spirochaetota bacterium]|nr:sulfatase-like hydrolase/transferase [Spirochaetota bacterium]